MGKLTSLYFFIQSLAPTRREYGQYVHTYGLFHSIRFQHIIHMKFQIMKKAHNNSRFLHMVSMNNYVFRLQSFHLQEKALNNADDEIQPVHTMNNRERTGSRRSESYETMRIRERLETAEGEGN